MSDILCPICKKPVPPVAPGEKSFSPFCSDRCKLIDLGRWLDGKYQIEVRGAVDPDDAQRAQDDEDEPPIRETVGMSILSEILEHNKKFVAEKRFERFATDMFPNKKILVVTCMDTRLVELLPAAMDLRQGDAKVLKTAGAIVSHPFGGVMRSILVAVYQLGVEEIAVVGHHDCGMTNMSCARIIEKARERGIDDRVIDTLVNSGLNLDQWLGGFENVRDGVRSSVRTIRTHPLLPRDIRVHGLLISPETGALEVVVEDA